jgi:hypothetical protein
MAVTAVAFTRKEGEKGEMEGELGEKERSFV